MSSFGEKELKKFGWREGKGLGAAEDGIKEPIRVTVKGDTKGVGYQKMECSLEFDNEWWKLAYNASAESVVVDNKEDNVIIDKKIPRVGRKGEIEKGSTNFVAEGEYVVRDRDLETIKETERAKQESELISLYKKNEASKQYSSPSGKQKRIAQQEARAEKKSKSGYNSSEEIN